MPHSPQGVLSASSAHGDGNSWPQVIASLGKDQRALGAVDAGADHFGPGSLREPTHAWALSLWPSIGADLTLREQQDAAPLAEVARQLAQALWRARVQRYHPPVAQPAQRGHPTGCPRTFHGPVAVDPHCQRCRA